MAGSVTNLEGKFLRQGRGESEGLPFDPNAVEGDVLMHLTLNQIEPDPKQPRRDLGDLSEMADSIRRYGIVQPIIVSRLESGRFRLIAGERRFTAATMAELSTVPAVVRAIDQHQRLKVQIVENVLRKDLDPFEEAASYKRLMAEFSYTQDDVAHEVGKTRTVISEILAVNRIGDGIREQYYRMSDKPKRSVLLEIAKASPGEEQDQLWEQVLGGGVTVRQAREQRGSVKQGKPETAPPTKRVFPTSHAVVTVQFTNGGSSDPEAALALQEALRLVSGCSVF